MSWFEFAVPSSAPFFASQSSKIVRKRLKNNRKSKHDCPRLFACGYRRAFGASEIAGIIAGIRSIPAKALPALPLTGAQDRNAKPTERQFKLSDGGWLFLVVMPSGSKLWRMAYRFQGIEKTLSFGGHPEVSLKDARIRRDEAKALVTQGIDPGQKRKLGQACRRSKPAPVP